MSRGQLAQRIYHLLQQLMHFAGRRGLWWVKEELEECLFHLLQPRRYQSIRSCVGSRRQNRDIVRTIAYTLESALKERQLCARVTGRPKRIASIHRKMTRAGVALDEIHDIRALRIIVDDIPTCYAALTVVHRLYVPLPGELDDYIVQPKRNGYRSLHTAVVDESGRPFEVQIRTRAMHRTAEMGSAAHWRYKEATGRPFADPTTWLPELEFLAPAPRESIPAEIEEPFR